MRRYVTQLLCLAVLLGASCRGPFSVRQDARGLTVSETGAPRAVHKRTRDYFIKSWLVCGPFEYASNDLDVDYLAAAGGEHDTRPALGMRHVGLGGAVACWKRVDVDGKTFNLLPHCTPNQNCIGYAYAELYAKRDLDVIVGFGSDDAGKVFINGEEVHCFRGARGLRVDNDFFKAHLNRGIKRILLKIGNNRGGWGFAFHVTSAKLLFRDPEYFSKGMVLTVDAADVANDILRLRMGDDRFKLMSELPPVSFEIDGIGRVDAAATKTVDVDLRKREPGILTIVARASGLKGAEIRREGWFYYGDIEEYFDSLATRAAGLFPARSPALVSIEGLLEALRRKPADHELARPGIAIILEMLADAEAGRDPLSHKIGPRLGGYWSEIDDTPRWYPFYVPKSYTPETPMPLLVLLHGYSVSNPALLDGYWESAFRPPAIAEREGVIVMYGFGRGNTDYWGIGHDDIMRGIEGIKRHYNVDEDRVYMAGGSMGGTGTWNIGVRAADQFAALAPDFGRADFRCWLAPEVIERMRPEQLFREERSRAPVYSMDNLFHLPSIVHHGEKDPIVVAGHSRSAVAWIKRIGGKVK